MIPLGVTSIGGGCLNHSINRTSRRRKWCMRIAYLWFDYVQGDRLKADLVGSGLDKRNFSIQIGGPSMSGHAVYNQTGFSVVTIREICTLESVSTH